MRLTDAISPVLANAAARVDRAADAFLAGAVALEATDLDGADFEARFSAGIRELATPWRRGEQSLSDARAAVVALGSADVRVVGALARIDAELAFLQRGYSHVGRVLMDLPRPLTPDFARMAVGKIGAAGRTIDASLRDAAAAIRVLAVSAGPRASPR